MTIQTKSITVRIPVFLLQEIEQKYPHSSITEIVREALSKMVNVDLPQDITHHQLQPIYTLLDTLKLKSDILASEVNTLRSELEEMKQKNNKKPTTRKPKSKSDIPTTPD